MCRDTGPRLRLFRLDEEDEWYEEDVGEVRECCEASTELVFEMGVPRPRPAAVPVGGLL